MQRSLIQEKSNKSFNMDADPVKIDNISSNATPMNRTPLRVQISYDETENLKQNFLSSNFLTSHKKNVSPLNAHHQKNKSSIKDRFMNKEIISPGKTKLESECNYIEEKSEIIISKNKGKESEFEKKIKGDGYDKPLAYDEYLNKKNRERIVKSRGEIMENFENEKSFIEEKLFELEKRLSHNESFNINLQNEKEKLKKDLNKLSLSIKTMNAIEQTNDFFIEKSSKSNEISAKKEIKMMISKLLKAKEKLSINQENGNMQNSSIQNSSHKKYNKSLQIYDKHNSETSQVSDFYERIETRKFNQERLQMRNKAPYSFNQYE